MKNFKELLIFFIAFTLVGCWSSTGDIEYKPAAKSLVEKQSETPITIAILDFTDQRFSIKKYRSKRKNNLIAVFFGGYKNPIRKVYGNQRIALDVMDAVEYLFKASGFNVKRYGGISDFAEPFDERIALKGQIKEFFLKSYPGLRSASVRLEAMIDIDLVLFDKELQRNIWVGKIVESKEMPSHKGVFTRTKQIFSFFNEFLSNGINEAWIDRGMLKALKSINK